MEITATEVAAEVVVVAAAVLLVSCQIFLFHHRASKAIINNSRNRIIGDSSNLVGEMKLKYVHL